MAIFFTDKTILLLSPQPWESLHISKHHYAKELAKNNSVYFITAPSRSLLVYSKTRRVEQGLAVLDYSIPALYWFQFKLPFLYKALIRLLLPYALSSNSIKADICFDFGCYNQYDSIFFIKAKYKIFFPVDDYEGLVPSPRGADLVLSVSTNIIGKFPKGVCHFINHGLAQKFEINARAALVNNLGWTKKEKIRVGYAGNIFLKYIDIELLKVLILEHPFIEFHFFGNLAFDPKNEDHNLWNIFLKQSANVILHGILHSDDLVLAYERMDAFLLCYKPDNVNYHGENSHKILEYLSTGKTILSSHISYYKNCDLLFMPPNQENSTMKDLFPVLMNSLEKYNSIDRMNARRNFALEYTYKNQLTRIEKLINEA